MIRYSTFPLVLLIMLVIFFSINFKMVHGSQAVPSNAVAHTLIDVASNRIIDEKNGTKRMRIASLTKVMTAIVAIEHGSISERVTVSKQAYAKEGSSLYLKLGETMSLRDLLYGLMLRSGNDAAVAIAEHVGGSLEGFVYMMNQKAEIIGISNTRFANPHGLDDSDQHYSTSNDMAKLTSYALHNSIFREIVKTKSIRVDNPNEQWDYKWYNKNKLLNLYEGADGVKTGYTKLAKRCLISSATRDNRQLVVVTLNDPTDWVDHIRLFDYGFQQIRSQSTIYTPLNRLEEHNRETYVPIGEPWWSSIWQTVRAKVEQLW
jgi:D-alanyl-D-alanine carboxypeptidase (penicillin-binding protein 5/6)